jgi:hypothetical protein
MGFTPWREVMPRLLALGAQGSPHAWSEPFKAYTLLRLAVPTVVCPSSKGWGEGGHGGRHPTQICPGATARTLLQAEDLALETGADHGTRGKVWFFALLDNLMRVLASALTLTYSTKVSWAYNTPSTPALIRRERSSSSSAPSLAWARSLFGCAAAGHRYQRWCRRRRRAHEISSRFLGRLLRGGRYPTLVCHTRIWHLRTPGDVRYANGRASLVCWLPWVFSAGSWWKKFMQGAR